MGGSRDVRLFGGAGKACGAAELGMHRGSGRPDLLALLDRMGAVGPGRHRKGVGRHDDAVGEQVRRNRIKYYRISVL